MFMIQLIVFLTSFAFEFLLCRLSLKDLQLRGVAKIDENFNSDVLTTLILNFLLSLDSVDL